MKYPEKIDLHLHTNVSDGTDSPNEILEQVRRAGIELFSITDHDDFEGGLVIKDILTEEDPKFLTGIEFSCKDNEGKYHILGYGFDPDSEPFREVVETGHRFRIQKVRARLDLLRDEFGFTFSEEDIKELFRQHNPGKPHIANLMVRYGYAETKEQAISDYINQLHVKSEYLRPEDAIEGILAGGGIPVLAHPSYGDGDQLIMGEEMDSRLRRLTGFGLEGVEAYYSGFTPKITVEMLSFAEKYGLYVTAGSDYHGKNKLVEIGDNGLSRVSDGAEGVRRFLDSVKFCTRANLPQASKSTAGNVSGQAFGQEKL